MSPQAFFMSLMHLDRNFLRTFPCRPFASACLEHSIDAALRGVAGAFSFICATATLPDVRNARLRAAANFHMPDPPNQDARAVIKATSRTRQQRHRRATVPSARRTIATSFEQNRNSPSLKSHNPQPATSQQPRDGNLQTLLQRKAHRLSCPAR